MMPSLQSSEDRRSERIPRRSNNVRRLVFWPLADAHSARAHSIGEKAKHGSGRNATDHRDPYRAHVLAASSCARSRCRSAGSAPARSRSAAMAGCASGSCSISPTISRSCRTASSRSGPPIRPIPTPARSASSSPKRSLALPKLDTPLVNDDLHPRAAGQLVRTLRRRPGNHLHRRLPVRPDRLSRRPPAGRRLAGGILAVHAAGQRRQRAAGRILFTFTVRNAGAQPVHGAIGATLKNVVGWDTAAEITGNFCPLFGGNVNCAHRGDGLTSIVMENPSLPGHHPHLGQLALSTTSERVHALPQWTYGRGIPHIDAPAPAGRRPAGANPRLRPQAHRLARGVPGHGRTGPLRARQCRARPGETWNGGLSAAVLARTRRIVRDHFLLSWSFPNHYVNYDQPARDFRYELSRSRMWIGNAYTKRFTNALDIGHVPASPTAIAWSGIPAPGPMRCSAAASPTWMSEFFAAQGALIRSPTIFRTEDGKLYGFEGTQGASTAFLPWRGYSGSCPLNCTHVWNYEQALSRLFPAPRTDDAGDRPRLRAGAGGVHSAPHAAPAVRQATLEPGNRRPAKTPPSMACSAPCSRPTARSSRERARSGAPPIGRTSAN